MSTFDFDAVIADAVASIKEFGRTVTVRKLDKTPVTDQPWRGTATPAPVDVEVSAVFIGPTKALRDDFVQGLDEVALVAGNMDFTGYHELLDGTKVWRITKLQVIKPGDKIVLTYLGINR